MGIKRKSKIATIFLIITSVGLLYVIPLKWERIKIHYYYWQIVHSHSEYPKKAYNYLCEHCPEALPFLIKAYKRKSLEYGIATCIMHNLTGFLGRTRSEEVIPVLINASSGADEGMLKHIVQTVKKMDMPEVVHQHLMKLQSSDLYWLREFGVRAAVTFNCKEAIPNLIELLDDKNDEVRGIAYESLCKLTKMKIGAKKELWEEWWNKSKHGTNPHQIFPKP